MGVPIPGNYGDRTAPGWQIDPVFDLFLRLLAGRSGQILNVQALANETGLSNNTIASWIGVLEQSHIIYKLRPYYANLGKRLIKSPKLYFLDSGLLCYLLNIFSSPILSLHPLRGQIFESYVVSELLFTGSSEGAYRYKDTEIRGYREVETLTEYLGLD